MYTERSAAILFASEQLQGLLPMRYSFDDPRHIGNLKVDIRNNDQS